MGPLPLSLGGAIALVPPTCQTDPDRCALASVKDVIPRVTRSDVAPLPDWALYFAICESSLRTILLFLLFANVINVSALLQMIYTICGRFVVYVLCKCLLVLGC